MVDRPAVPETGTFPPVVDVENDAELNRMNTTAELLRGRHVESSYCPIDLCITCAISTVTGTNGKEKADTSYLGDIHGISEELGHLHFPTPPPSMTARIGRRENDDAFGDSWTLLSACEASL